MKDKIAIVTGASRGIGKEIARKLSNEGFAVMLFGRDEKALQQVKYEINQNGNNAEYFVGNVADENFVESSVNNILSIYGSIDVLINNAGVGILKKFSELTLDEFKLQVDANVYGVFNFCSSVLPSMIQRREGDIINIVSLAGKNGFVGGTTYGATKHAVLGFTKSLFLEVREYNIRVAAVCPGSVDTEFSDKSERGNGYLDKILKSEDIAESVFTILKLPRRALISEIDIRPTNPK